MQSYVKNNIPQSLIGIFIACIITNSTVLLPATSMVIVLEYAQLINPIAVAIVGALGTSVGELTGYYMGRAGSNIIKSEKIKKIKIRFDRHTYIWIFVFALLPLPIFDIVGLLAGSTNTNVFCFYFTCVAGKFIKMGCYILMFQFLESMTNIFM